MILPKLYPILDVGLLEERRCPIIDAADAILHAGCQILQWRCKRNPSEADMRSLDKITAMCVRRRATLVVNDRVDIARMMAAGLHLGQDDLSPTQARELLGADTFIGFSTHHSEQLLTASTMPVDYVALGPIFATLSKRNPDPVVGLDNLKAWAGLTEFPLVAIGGITRQSALKVLAAGADSLAVIGDLYPEECTGIAIEKRVKEWVRLLRAQ